MKKEMLKPAIIVLALVSVFAIAFVMMNTLAFAGAREDVVRSSEASIVYEGDDLVIEPEDNGGDLDGILLEAEKSAVDANEAALEAQAKEDRAILSRLGVSDEDMEAVLAEVQRIREFDGGYGVIAINQESYYSIDVIAPSYPVIVLRGGVILEEMPEDFVPFFEPARGFRLPPGYLSLEDFVDRPPVHEISFNSDTLLGWFGSDSILSGVSFTGEMNFTMIDHSRWPMVTQPHRHVEDYILQPHHLSFEQVAILVALAIFEEYGKSIDGLDGYMTFLGHGNSSYFSEGIWSGFIINPYRTEHNMGYEWIHFMINGVTGEIIHLDMTTPNNPWFG